MQDHVTLKQQQIEQTKPKQAEKKKKKKQMTISFQGCKKTNKIKSSKATPIRNQLARNSAQQQKYDDAIKQ